MKKVIILALSIVSSSLVVAAESSFRRPKRPTYKTKALIVIGQVIADGAKKVVEKVSNKNPQAQDKTSKLNSHESACHDSTCI